jgi:pimeloyl-ACP methyl ester carboxylesterase
VHGFGSGKLVCEDVCQGLANVFSFYAIDLPGSGESLAPKHFQYTLEHFADVLTDFIVMKDLKKLTLVGASLGAAVVRLPLLRNRDELTPRVRLESTWAVGAARPRVVARAVASHHASAPPFAGPLTTDGTRLSFRGGYRRRCESRLGTFFNPSLVRGRAWPPQDRRGDSALRQ